MWLLELINKIFLKVNWVFDHLHLYCCAIRRFDEPVPRFVEQKIVLESLQVKLRRERPSRADSIEPTGFSKSPPNFILREKKFFKFSFDRFFRFFQKFSGQSWKLKKCFWIKKTLKAALKLEVSSDTPTCLRYREYFLWKWVGYISHENMKEIEVSRNNSENEFFAAVTFRFLSSAGPVMKISL